MKSAVLVALLLAFPLSSARAKEKKAGAHGTSAGAASRCDPLDLEGCAKLAEQRLAKDPGDASFDDERKEAQQQLRVACAGGLLRACSSLADSEERFDSAEGAFRAATLRTRTCAAGNLRDCERLGSQLEAGRGLAADPGRAAEVLRRCCEAGSAACCRRLSGLFDNGRAVVSEPPLRWRERGCELGDADACSEAADFLGRGVLARDAKKARALDEKACGLGRGASCWSLSRQEPAEVTGKKLELLKQGCDGSDGDSCWELAQLTMNGKASGPRDDEKALDFLMLACAQGKPGEACRDATAQSLRALLPPPPPAPPRVHNWAPALVAGAATIGLGVTGAYQALQSRSLASDLGSDPAHDTQIRRDEIDRFNRRSRLFYAGAAVFAITTATLAVVF